VRGPFHACARHDSNVRPLPPQGKPAVGSGWRRMAELGSESCVAGLSMRTGKSTSREIPVALGRVLDALLPSAATVIWPPDEGLCEQRSVEVPRGRILHHER
jgi:hypothetical protein